MDKLKLSVVGRWLLVIIIIAAFLRLYNIAEIPPGLYPDEAMNGNNALESLSTGNFKVFYPENNGREGLFINIQALFLKILLPLSGGNPDPWMLRLPSALFGILTVLGVYFLAKELFRENPKSKILNPKQIQNSNTQNDGEPVILSSPKANKRPRRFFASFKMTLKALIRISRSEKIALLSSFFLATSFWHINFSRIGFRAIMAPCFLVWSLFFLLKALNQTIKQFQFPNSNFQTNSNSQNSKIWDFRFWILSLLAGAVYGLGFYSYIAYRATPLLILVIILLYWLKIKKLKLILKTPDVQNIDDVNWRASDVQKLKSIRKKILLSTFYFLISAIVVFAPLGLYFLNNPQDFFGRTTQISIFNSPTPFRDLGMNVLKTAGMFNFSGDHNWRHNIAGRPLLFWPVGIFFVIGVIIGFVNILKNSKFKFLNSKQCLNSNVQNSKPLFWPFKFRILNLFRASCFEFWILFAWLIVAALPVVISNEGIPHALRAILMAPPAFILAGIGGLWLYELAKNTIARDNIVRTKMKIFNIFVLIFLLLLIFESYSAYFILWGKNFNTAGAFAADYVRLGQELQELPKELPKYVAVEASGVDVRGMPMPTQTIMFLTDTFTPEKQKEKNLYYIFPTELGKVDRNKSYIVYLR